MESLLSDLGWKDLLALAGGLFSLLLSGIAYRRAGIAEQRAERQEKLAAAKEKNALALVIVEDKAKALVEITAMRTRWYMLLLMANADNMGETVFAPTLGQPLTLDQHVEQALQALDYREKVIRDFDARTATPEEQIKFRETVTGPLGQMSADLVKAEGAVQHFAKQLHADRRKNGPQGPLANDGE